MPSSQFPQASCCRLQSASPPPVCIEVPLWNHSQFPHHLWYITPTFLQLHYDWFVNPNIDWLAQVSAASKDMYNLNPHRLEWLTIEPIWCTWYASSTMSVCWMEGLFALRASSMASRQGRSTRSSLPHQSMLWVDRHTYLQQGTLQICMMQFNNAADPWREKWSQQFATCGDSNNKCTSVGVICRWSCLDCLCSFRIRHLWPKPFLRENIM